MKVTIKDIAHLSNVSTATVSKILNKKDKNISEATRKRVLAIIEENNYVPNRIASSLVTRKTKTIGMVIPSIADPFLPDLVRGAEDKAKEEGYSLILCNTDNSKEKEEFYVEMLQEKMVDGIIFTATFQKEQKFEKIIRVNVPIILIDREIEGLQHMGRVKNDTRAGALEGVRYMISRGYKKIFHIAGPLNSMIGRDRCEGYKIALEEAGLPYDEAYVTEGPFTMEWGTEATIALLASGLEFDAIFCSNDWIALGAMKVLTKAGKSVPEDVGIVGFDDTYLARITEPEITTVRQPNYEMGHKAVEMLIEMSNSKEPAYSEAHFTPNLVIRGTLR